jgi:micrococcal nuclease
VALGRGKAARFVRAFLLLFALGGMATAYATRYLGALDGGAAAPEEVEAGDRLRAEVERVVDGDTIVVRLDGRSERVRYIGIDTPETHHPDKPVQRFGPEATEANRRLVEGRTVLLELDVEPRDKYGRLLAYVYLEDGTFVNASLVEDGYARLMTIPPNLKHTDLFRRLLREAREAERGLWAPRAAQAR